MRRPSGLNLVQHWCENAPSLVQFVPAITKHTSRLLGERRLDPSAGTPACHAQELTQPPPHKTAIEIGRSKNACGPPDELRGVALQHVQQQSLVCIGRLGLHTDGGPKQRTRKGPEIARRELCCADHAHAVEPCSYHVPCLTVLRCVALDGSNGQVTRLLRPWDKPRGSATCR